MKPRITKVAYGWMCTGRYGVYATGYSPSAAYSWYVLKWFENRRRGYTGLP